MHGYPTTDYFVSNCSETHGPDILPTIGFFRVRIYVWYSFCYIIWYAKRFKGFSYVVTSDRDWSGCIQVFADG